MALRNSKKNANVVGRVCPVVRSDVCDLTNTIPVNRFYRCPEFLLLSTGSFW